MSFRAVSITMFLVLAGVSGLHLLDLRGQPNDPGIEDVLGALRAAAPLSVSRELFEDPENQAAIGQALTTIDLAAPIIEGHGQDTDLLIAQAAASMANEASDSHDEFSSGNLHRARVFLMDLTNYCFGCHSQITAEGRPSVSSGVWNDPKVAALPTAQRMFLAVSMDNVEQAAALGEEVLANSNIPPAQADADGVVAGYMAATIQRQGDFLRCRTNLELLKKRRDLPTYLAAYLDTWIPALLRMGDLRGSNPLAISLGLLQEGQTLNRTPGDRRGLVHLMTASYLLGRFAQSDAVTAQQAPQVYYLLGLAEIYIDPAGWTPKAELYLEIAVRTDPHSPFAASAYNSLNQVIRSRYSASKFGIPPSEQAKLDELKTLMEES